jgi:glutamate--cysteine ligase
MITLKKRNTESETKIMTDFKEIILSKHLSTLFSKASFGIEKESQRITDKGSIAKTNHPAVFGNRSFHPYIQTDFAETQPELISPPTQSVDEMYEWLTAIHDVVLRSLPQDEYLLPLSIPPVMPASDEVRVAVLDSEADVQYREYLVSVYGNKKQMVSGIHYNFELDPALIKELYQIEKPALSLKSFQSEIYLKMAHNFLRYQWILTYLMGASIAADASYFEKEETKDFPLQHFARSIRSSQYGYVNKGDVHVSFDSIEAYVNDIEEMVASGKLSAEKEFYSTVRFRGVKRARDLLTNGIAYLEFRLFDLNPFAAFGMHKKDMHFIHYFLLYLLWMDEDATEEQMILGKQLNYRTALENPLTPSAYQAEGTAFLNGMLEMLDGIHADKEIVAIVKEKSAAFHHPEKTVAGQMVTAVKEGQDLTEMAVALAKKYKAEAWKRPYALRGFDDMELSTQILLFDAIQKGLKINILDRHDQFISLTYQNHREYVKNGNMTSKDSYIGPLIMENKVVTKKILAENGFAVPASGEYHSVSAALKDYPLFTGKGIVIKPKSTNYGLGISIFKDGASLENYEKAIRIAFEEDEDILVEDYLQGTEYRFFVIGNETKAVLLRVPANVKGDGIRTIRELVDEKNKDSMRGKNHRSPLERIEMGELEKLTIQGQGYTFESIPSAGEIVRLRDNSNISTGGDSIDFTDQMDDSYKKLAVDMTAALGVAVCGVDFIIPDYSRPSTKEAPGYGVIEANFNPAMLIHIYPYQGESRRLTMDVLRLLFPEMLL